jgi:hypothetical protein
MGANREMFLFTKALLGNSLSFNPAGCNRRDSPLRSEEEINRQSLQLYKNKTSTHILMNEIQYGLAYSATSSSPSNRQIMR